jgi:hypothetical protein
MVQERKSSQVDERYWLGSNRPKQWTDFATTGNAEKTQTNNQWKNR